METTIGDRLLKQVAQRLAGTLRTGDTVPRFGSDEFALLLPNIASARDAVPAAVGTLVAE